MELSSESPSVSFCFCALVSYLGDGCGLVLLCGTTPFLFVPCPLLAITYTVADLNYLLRRCTVVIIDVPSVVHRRR